MREDGDLVIARPMRDYLFLILIHVVLDDMIPGLDNVRLAAVIDLQFEHLDIRSVFLHIQKILHQRSSPSVDALEIVSDHSDVGSSAGEHPHELELDPIGILCFVHEYVIEFVLPLRQRLLAFFEEQVGEEQEIVEIQGIGFFQGFLIFVVDLSHMLIIIRFTTTYIGLRFYSIVLLRGDESFHFVHFVDILEIHPLEDILDG